MSERWGQALKVKRIALGETQTQFAARFSTTPNTVSRWETGEYSVPAEVAWWLTHNSEIPRICPRCGGGGIVQNELPLTTREEVDNGK